MCISIKLNQRCFLGFPFSFGVFQAYYTEHEFSSDSVASVAAIGTTALV